VKIFDVKDGIEWPIIFFDKEDVPNATASSGDHSWAANRAFVVAVNNSA
jgi:hypothetical protein